MIPPVGVEIAPIEVDVRVFPVAEVGVRVAPTVEVGVRVAPIEEIGDVGTVCC